MQSVSNEHLLPAGCTDHRLIPNVEVNRFVCAHSKAGNKAVRIRSYTTENAVKNLCLEECCIWEAARATSAASGFFDSIKIGLQEYVDGATGKNNPVEEVLAEAEAIWPGLRGEDIECIVSIGTGVSKWRDYGNNLAQVMKTLVAVATETEETEKRFYRNRTKVGLDGRYFRLNVDHGLADVALNEHAKLNIVEAATEAYLKEPRVQEVMKAFRITNDVQGSK